MWLLFVRNNTHFALLLSVSLSLLVLHLGALPWRAYGHRESPPPDTGAAAMLYMKAGISLFKLIMALYAI